jgi:hypothetical protein
MFHNSHLLYFDNGFVSTSTLKSVGMPINIMVINWRTILKCAFGIYFLRSNIRSNDHVVAGMTLISMILLAIKYSWLAVGA